ncbi:MULTISPECIES: DUF1624 domain-containing protein [unclassified Duganella]|jgi:uncharacterized membrane protein|uniref:DUF1624 domain-containing protein n=1 Tax=unclassified Duganella TaxID=2636909 RepID=UPI000889A378|nr:MULTISPECIES: heparan-alpha-glucosaminide N-acetyltransferase domain-containing protein [unclassified Duganella]SDF76365.1 Uncharacterized membrane protein [Duganella sp. OV458]SDI53030.1 Uncharacterized membrane protein [Duganella sp. OV510]
MSSVSVRGARVASIDVLRGLVMMIMMLDHVREAFFLHHPVSDPMKLAETDPAFFFGRVAAHFCAPVFVFLTGLSAWLYAHPSSGPRSPTGFLFKRGLFLILLEITVITAVWAVQLSPPTIYLQVIWAIGLSMIALSLLHRLPRGVLIALGLVIVFGHNLLTPIAFQPGDAGYIPWTILHDRGFLVSEGLLRVKVSYPLLPWIGVIVLGYAIGPWYASATAPAQRRKLLLRAGVCALALLAVLRGLNIYGETLPWEPGVDALHSVMSFLNVTKYPPSLAFLLLTLGVGLLVLAWLEQRDNWFLRVSAVFGGAPMFYYLLHLYVLLALQMAAIVLLGANYGTRYEFDSIWPVWVMSAVLIPLLYWPCRAFGHFKRRTKMAWVRYL